MSSPLLDLEGVSRTFAGDGVETEALADIDLHVCAGEFVCLTGPSGSGKTTLMNILGCLDRPTAGTYRIDGEDVTSLPSDDLARLRRETFGFVFQNYNLLESATARDNVELPAIYTGRTRGERQRRARDILESIGLGDRLEHRAAELSGGEQQRVAIARALMNGARVILADEPTGALDTEQGEDVLSLLDQLSARGHAVIVVSHDAAVAAVAHRQVELSDGRIVADPGSGTPKTPFGSSEAVRGHGMSWLTAVRGGLVSLRSGRLRAALTVSSVALGVWSVLALLSLAEGVRRDTLAAMGRMGASQLSVGGATWVGDTVNFLPRTLADAQAIAEQVANVGSVETAMWKRLPVSGGGENIDEMIIRGKSLFEPRTTQNVPWPLERGTYLTQQDSDEVAQVAVVGPTVRNRLFAPDVDPVGELVYIDGLPFVVKGVLTPHPRREGEGEMIWTSESGYEGLGMVIHIPFKTGAEVLFRTDNLNGLHVRVADMARLDETAADIKDLMFRRHGREGYTVENEALIWTAGKKLSRTHAAILGTIAGISLLVGGLGTMAVTLAAVSQRRREIGLRMAVGARRRDISAQFLVETTVATMIGGACGTLLGYAGGSLLSRLAEAPVAFAPWFVAVALGCSIATGLAFGIVPARRTARLDPVAALASD